MSYHHHSKSNYYEDNLQNTVIGMEKMPENKLLSRGHHYEYDNTYNHPSSGHQRQQSTQSRLQEPINMFESQSLLGPGPVKLTPSWEEKNLPNDELNFKHLMMEDYFIDKPPKDRCYLVYFILLLHGIGTLMPWNIFITAEEYFTAHKLNVTASSLLVYPIHEEYKKNFLSYLGLAAHIPNVVFNWVNLFVQNGSDMTVRIVVSIVIEVVVIIGTIILAMVDSSSWPGLFFWITMASMSVLNMSNGIYQNSVYGMASRLPLKYCNAVVLGSNISGTLTAITMILSTMFAPNIRTATIYYFISVLFIFLACFDSYFALPLLRFYRFHERLFEREVAKRGRLRRTPYWAIFKKTFPQLFNLWLIYFTTLTVYPAVLVQIKMIDPHFFTTSQYFTPVTCFLFYNLSAVVGNMFACCLRWPSPSWLCLPVILRIFTIPYFVFCYYLPKDRQRNLLILFYNDWAYSGMTLVLGWTGGYFTSLAIMYIKKSVEPQHAAIAGMMAAASMCLGFFCGINFSLLMPWFVENFTFFI